MVTTSVAATSVKSAVKVHPPASPFAELLRRSRFASFDPQIRQTYYAPPAYAHRGNWGLKRPLALRRRNAFITLTKSFDDPAQYTEWDHAENEVRFIRRFEEMEVRPTFRKQTPWHQYLGSKNSTGWMMDSEFCERYEGPEAEEETNAELKRLYEEEQKKRTEYVTQNLPSSINDYRTGNYAHREALNNGAGKSVALTPNIDAMSPRQFERYVEKLRELRPQFKKYLEENKEATEGKSVFELSQDLAKKHHQHFLEHHTAKSFADVTSGDIEQRPHPVAGLLYSHPSPLQSQLYSRPQPGIILSGALEKFQPKPTKPGEKTVFVASFGGMSPIIRKEHWEGKVPLLDHSSETGINRENLVRSVATMRLKPNTVYLEEPPLSVGNFHRGLFGTRLKAEAMVDSGRGGFNQTNPYKPGTMEYASMQGAMAKGTVKAASEARPAAVSFSDKWQKKANQRQDGEKMTSSMRKNQDHLLKTLSGMLNG